MPLPPSRRGALSVTNMSPFPRAAQTRNYRREGRSAILNRELIWKRSSASSFMGAPHPAEATGKGSKREALSPQSDRRRAHWTGVRECRNECKIKRRGECERGGQ